jgi:hypothetical protein
MLGIMHRHVYFFHFTHCRSDPEVEAELLAEAKQSMQFEMAEGNTSGTGPNAEEIRKVLEGRIIV